MRVINRMNDLLQTCTVKDEAYAVISLMAGKLFELHPGAVAIVNPETQSLETVSRWGGENFMEATFELQDCWGIRGGKAHEALGGSEGLPCTHFSRHPEGGSYCLPLTVQGETFGLLTLTGRAAGGDGTQPHAHPLAESMGEAIKLSLSNLRLRENLREQAMRDSLTGLFNRRFLDETLPRELHRATRANTPLCIAMLDLDHFKQLNDALGHQTGDLILRSLGKMLSEFLRKSDIAVRYGGEEFLLVLPDTSLSGTLQRMDEIRALMQLMPIPDSVGGVSQITISVGVAMAGIHGSTAAELIRAADNALYSAKEQGRDRVVVFNA
jgi:diguanylate cyclase (GGDEF)-like protein